MRQQSGPIRLRTLGVIYLLLVLPVPEASAKHYYFRLYTAADGLSQAVVQAIHQDRKGYLWIGTQAGLNRYDGASMMTYSIRHGLASDWISAIAEDSSGRIWLATLSGVSSWNGRKFINYGVADGLADNRIVSLVIGQDDSVWCATSKGVCQFDGQRWHVFTMADGLPAVNANAILVDHKGRLWAATTNGLAYLEGERFTLFDPLALRGRNIRSLSEDAKQQLWLGLDDSLRVYLGDRLVGVYTRSSGLDRGPVVALCIDRHGSAWLGTPHGLGVVRDGEITFLNAGNGVKYSDIRSLFEDREGILWVGVYGGLYKFQGRAFTNYDQSDGLGSDSTRPILRDREGILWVGTTGGLSRFDGQRWRNFTVADGLADNGIDSLLQDREGKLWIGTRAGLDIFDGTRFIQVPQAPGDRVLSIVEDQAGTIWCAGMLGSLYRRVDGRFEPVSVGGQSFSDARLLLDGRGWLWASGDNGLSRWDGQSWRTYTTKDGLAGNQPYFLCEDPKGKIWFGYHSSNGVTSFDGAHFLHYTSSDGLSNDAVYSLGVDQKGNLWIGTARGVDRFDGQVFTHFGTEEGYANDESNAGGFFADRDGTLWFGTLGGLSHYDPRFDPSSGAAPKVELTEIRLGKQSFSQDDSPSVNYGMNELFVRVAALSFINEKQLSLQYRLAGLSQDWLPMQGREVRITNLPSRAYALEVRARKYQGPWSVPVQFSFHIQVPFWLSWWFWMLTGSLVIATLYGGYQVQNLRARRKEERLERMVEARTRELAQKTEELESFIYTISHDLKAPVVSLQGLASLLELDLGKQASADATFYLERIHANTDHMQRLINQLLNLSRIGRLKEPRLSINIAELTREAVNDLQGQIELKKASVKIADDLPILIGERDRLKQVMINLIANALHYSQPNVPPMIEVGSRDESGEGSYHTVFVRDNGIGVAREHHERIFDIFYRVDGNYADSESTGVGLAIVKRIINSHGGNVWVESEGPGSGSTFCFRLPKESAQKQ
jgi:ligand-binding sensor domain-containing protein/signal transduction histidine kinase